MVSPVTLVRDSSSDHDHRESNGKDQHQAQPLLSGVSQWRRLAGAATTAIPLAAAAHFGACLDETEAHAADARDDCNDNS